MAHLNPQGTDWVNAAFIVHPKDPKVLLVQHKKLGTLLPIGGHIELDAVDADPDAALIREIREETGMKLWPGEPAQVQDYDAYVVQTPEQIQRAGLCRHMDPVSNNQVRPHWVPWAMETHLFPPIPGHKHLCLVYLVFALKPDIVLEAEAHDDIRWFSAEDLAHPTWGVRSKIQMYGTQAILARYPKRRSV